MLGKPEVLHLTPREKGILRRRFRPSAASFARFVLGRIASGLSEWHRTGIMPRDRVCWPAFMIEHALTFPVGAAVRDGAVLVGKVARPALLLECDVDGSGGGSGDGPPVWPRAWREVLDAAGGHKGLSLPLPQLALFDFDDGPWGAFDLCVGVGDFEEAMLHLEALISLRYLARMRTKAGPRNDKVTSAALLMLLPFETRDAAEIGRVIGTFLGRLEGAYGGLSRRQDCCHRPVAEIHPSLGVPDV